MRSLTLALAIAASLSLAPACSDDGDESATETNTTTSTDTDAQTETDADTDTGAETDTGEPACEGDQIACDDDCIDPIAPTTTALQARIFAGCAFQGCHGEDGFREMLELSSVDISQDNLVGVPAVQRPAWMLVEPGAPQMSYLVNKLRGEDLDPASDGNPSQAMPIGTPLCEAKIEAVEAWIAAGAPKE